MDSIAMPSLPAFSTISSFTASPTAAIPAEVDAVSGCDTFRGSVPLGLLQSDDVTALCSTGSQEGVDVADAVDAFDSCCADIKSAERELKIT